MIKVQDMSFKYPKGDFSLKLSSLVVEAGQRVAVIGPSGSGKTTLLNIFSGITTTQSGSVKILGKEVSALSEQERRVFRAQNIGFVFQDAALVDYLNAQENIIYPFRVGPGLKLDRSVRDRATALGTACGLGKLLRSYPSAMSGGERQRVAICRALITNPKLVLADEPTGSLDPLNKVSVLDTLFKRSSELGAAVIMVTHDHALLDRFDEVIDFTQLSSST